MSELSSPLEPGDGEDPAAADDPVQVMDAAEAGDGEEEEVSDAEQDEEDQEGLGHDEAAEDEAEDGEEVDAGDGDEQPAAEVDEDTQVMAEDSALADSVPEQGAVPAPAPVMEIHVQHVEPLDLPGSPEQPGSNSGRLSTLHMEQAPGSRRLGGPAPSPRTNAPRASPDYRMPDKLIVNVEIDGEFRSVELDVVRYPDHEKPFLGGYRHRLTGVEYHHATAQTRPDYRKISTKPRNSRSTQTAPTITREQQTAHDAATQMPRPGYHVSTEGDRIRIAGKYVTADEVFAHRLEKILIIQRAFQKWKHRRYIESLKKIKAEYDDWQEQDATEMDRLRAARLRSEYERRLKPKTRADFDNMYAALANWKKDKEEHINETLGGPDRKVALYGLLDKEARIVAGIGRHKTAIEETNTNKRVSQYLKKTAAPHRWRAFDGGTTLMETNATIRARQLKELYDSVTAPISTYGERMETLLLLKCTVQEHDCKLTRDICEQIGRETECITRGLRDEMMKGMRKRIAVLLLQYIKNPLFNPEAARHNKVPVDPQKLVNRTFKCPGCCAYLPSTEFEISSHTKAVGRCKACMQVDNDARTREDLAYYRFLLKELRRRETEYGDETKVAFLLQAEDMRYLIDDVWMCRSALSQSNDPFELVFARWNHRVQWTPWNCLLLTKREASKHKIVKNPEAFYGEGLCLAVQQRHMLAFQHFQAVPGLAGFLSKHNVRLGTLYPEPTDEDQPEDKVSTDDERADNQHAEGGHPDDENAEGENAEGENGDDEHADDEDADTERAEGEHPDDEHAEGDHGDDEHTEGDHGDDEHADVEHADDEHADDEHADDEHADDEHADDEVAGDEHSDSAQEEDIGEEVGGEIEATEQPEDTEEEEVMEGS